MPPALPATTAPPSEDNSVSCRHNGGHHVRHEHLSHLHKAASASVSALSHSRCEEPGTHPSSTVPGALPFLSCLSSSSSSHAQSRPVVIGYSCNRKKQLQFFEDLARVAAATGGRFCLVPLPEPADNAVSRVAEDEEHGPSSTSFGAPAGKATPSAPLRCDAILHKRTDDMAVVATGDDRAAARRVRLLEEALERNAGVVAVDDVAGVWKLIDRVSISSVVRLALDKCRRVRHLAWATLVPGSSRKCIEDQVAPLEFPLILKRRLACGTKASHEMVVVHDISGVHAALAEVFSVPSMVMRKSSQVNAEFSGGQWPAEAQAGPSAADLDHKGCLRFNADDVVAQEFIPDHGGVVFKVYAIGDRIEVNPRSSITGTYRPRCSEVSSNSEFKPRYYRFDSQNITKIHLSKVQSATAPVPPLELSASIVRALSDELGLTLLGIDIVFDVQRCMYAVVDVNYFPGYKGMDDVHLALLTHVEQLVERKKIACDKMASTGGNLLDGCAVQPANALVLPRV